MLRNGKDLEEHLNKRVQIVGRAVTYDKDGVILELEDETPVRLEHLDSWPADVEGSVVVVEGNLQRHVYDMRNWAEEGQFAAIAPEVFKVHNASWARSTRR